MKIKDFVNGFPKNPEHFALQGFKAFLRREEGRKYSGQALAQLLGTELLFIQ